MKMWILQLTRCLNKTHSVRLEQIQEKIELLYDVVVLPASLRTFPETTFISSGEQGSWRERRSGYTCSAALSDSTANSTDRLFRDWRRAPQVPREEAQGGREEPSEPNKLQETTRLSDGGRAVARHRHRPLTYLSSLPNISRSVAFSLERSAIFSALSRSLLKLLWTFLINSRLVENWAWMSAGRYSYRKERQLSTGNSLSFSLNAQQTLAWVAILLVMNSSPVFLKVSRSLVWTSCGRQTDRHFYYAAASL